ncbi:MAG: 30S ribosomal protein S30e [Nitrososphaerota archaeon]|nr:30S ribosomal protein S30e [Nitrososphaerota archaeon]
MPTHGSLTKSGKVRSQTPKLQARERTFPIPKVSSREKFRKRFQLKRRAGQNWVIP